MASRAELFGVSILPVNEILNILSSIILGDFKLLKVKILLLLTKFC